MKSKSQRPFDSERPSRGERRRERLIRFCTTWKTRPDESEELTSSVGARRTIDRRDNEFGVAAAPKYTCAYCVCTGAETRPANIRRFQSAPRDPVGPEESGSDCDDVTRNLTRNINWPCHLINDINNNLVPHALDQADKTSSAAGEAPTIVTPGLTLCRFCRPPAPPRHTFRRR